MAEVYLDNCATTKTDRHAAQIALELMERDYGNPSSLHKKGLEAQLRLDRARSQVAAAIGCGAGEIVFTSGGTEANNLALLGGAEARRRRGTAIVAMSTEHSSVLEPLRHLEAQGFRLRLVPPLPSGEVDADAFVDAVDADTILAACMLVNSEVGVIAPIAELARRCRRKSPGLLFHCDGVQALGKTAFSVQSLGVDTLSVSGHKLHAPKGVGALYVKKGVRLLPLLYGGGQQRGLRPGTENTSLACAFGYAAEKAAGEQGRNAKRVAGLYEYFVNKSGRLPGVCMNSPATATPYICNLSAPGYRSETMLHFLEQQEIYVSSGSACSRGAKSHVLTAMGLAPGRIDSALRVSFTAENTTGEIDLFFEVLAQGMERLARSRVG